MYRPISPPSASRIVSVEKVLRGVQVLARLAQQACSRLQPMESTREEPWRVPIPLVLIFPPAEHRRRCLKRHSAGTRFEKMRGCSASPYQQEESVGSSWKLLIFIGMNLAQIRNKSPEMAYLDAFFQAADVGC